MGTDQLRQFRRPKIDSIYSELLSDVQADIDSPMQFQVRSVGMFFALKVTGLDMFFYAYFSHRSAPRIDRSMVGQNKGLLFRRRDESQIGISSY